MSSMKTKETWEVNGRTFFRVSGFGFRSRVSGSRFRVSGSKSVFKESSIGHCNYLSNVHATQTIIT